MKTNAEKWLALTMMVASSAALAGGPLVIGSGEKVDPQQVARILNPDAVKMRSIRSDETAPSVALRIPFGFGSAKIPAESSQQLEALSQAIKQSGAKVVIEGHTDAVGGSDYNRRLSEKRAIAVKDALVANYGIAPNTLRAVGLGKSRPLPDLDPASGDNRRVEFRADR